MLKNLRILWIMALFLFITCNTASANDTIRLGVISPVGENAWAVPIDAQAVEMAVEEVNSSGGINGKKVKLEYFYSDCFDRDKLLSGAEEVVKSEINIAIDPACPNRNKEALRVYAKAGVLTISPNSYASGLSNGNKFPYLFRMRPSGEAQPRLNTAFAIERLNARKIAVISNKEYSDNKEYAYNVRRLAAKSGQASVVLELQVVFATEDLSTVVKLIRSSKADTLLITSSPWESELLLREIRKAKLDINILLDDSGYPVTSMDADAAEGIYISMRPNFLKLPEGAKFAADYAARFNENPGEISEHSYAAAQVLLQAVKAAGDDSAPEAIAKALRGQTFDTVMGKVRFDKDGELAEGGYKIYRFEDGEFTRQDFE